MDRLDRHILEQLQRDSSLSNAELAAAIGLSASQVSRRRARLETTGLIRGYGARLDARALGFSMDVFIRVTLTAHSADTATEFSHFLRSLPELRSAHALTGTADYLLHAKVRDLDALSALVNRHLLPHRNVHEVRSDIALQTIIEEAPLPLHQLQSVDLHSRIEHTS